MTFKNYLKAMSRKKENKTRMLNKALDSADEQISSLRNPIMSTPHEEDEYGNDTEESDEMRAERYLKSINAI